MSGATGTERLSQIDADLLLAFDAILREGNVTQAAGRLGLTQPAMSARLTRLRAIFNDRLFVAATAGRGVVPTPRAESLRHDLGAALHALRQMVEPKEPFDPLRSERAFVVAMQDNPAAMLAPRLLAGLHRSAPRSRLSIVSPSEEKIAEGLENGDIDIAIGLASDANGSWAGRVVLQERFVTAMRRGSRHEGGPLDLDAFCALSHLVVSARAGGFSGVVDEALARLGRRRRVVASVQSYALAPLVIEATDLVCTLPKRLLSRFRETLDLFAPPLDLETFRLSAFWHTRNQDDAGHAWFRERLMEAARVPGSG